MPKCKAKRQTGGDDHGYLPLLPSDVSKCTELYDKCPTYRNANKKTCPSCGATYLKDEAGTVFIDEKPYSTCPQCGSSEAERQIREEVPNEPGIVQEEEVVGEEA